MNEAILFRGVERLLIVLTAAFFGYLGYRLFCLGRTDAPAKMTFKSKFAQLTFSGTGSGLIFMAFGAIVLLYALIFGGAKATESPVYASSKDLTTLHSSIEQLQEILIHAIDVEQSKTENFNLRQDSTAPPKASREMQLNSPIGAMENLRRQEDARNMELTNSLGKLREPTKFTPLSKAQSEPSNPPASNISK